MKFINLLKKELKDLLSAQTIMGMVITLVIFYGLGTIMGDVMEKAMSSSEITVCDEDNTTFTNSVLQAIENQGNKVIKVSPSDQSDPAKLMKNINSDSLVIIPEGFTKTVLEDKKQAELKFINVMRNSSLSGTISSEKNSAVIDIIKEAVSSTLLLNYGLSDNDITTVKEPVLVKDITVIKDRSAEISYSAVSSLTMMQNMFLPIVIFILVMFSSQMIISAISTEKIDKTLETLLSAPVSRISVLLAKMLAAAIVAMLNAGVYMIGFSKYMNGMTGGAIEKISSSAEVSKMLSSLGLQFAPADYVLLGLQMFMTLLISLGVALILGAMVNDAKSAQTLIMPIMLCAMLPYLLSMFTSINSLPLGIKILIYLIPFTHTFTATDNLMFDNMTIFWGGFAYQVILFIIIMFFAVRLFTSDKIFTASLNFMQKSRAKRQINSDR
ncbi:MAG: ABC-type Na+ efflux pump, permease component [Oscillospiraceae bacterium]|jgi:ABC-2 type transport system permease protein|nr:ABC-type Na+ efflux pump, permease component [Oscillospiraceae bacterium]